MGVDGCTDKQAQTDLPPFVGGGGGGFSGWGVGGGGGVWSKCIFLTMNFFWGG